MSKLTEPLRKFIQKEVLSVGILNKTKHVLTLPAFLRYYDVNKDVTLSVDASSKSLGVGLFQENQLMNMQQKRSQVLNKCGPKYKKKYSLFVMAVRSFMSIY